MLDQREPSRFPSTPAGWILPGTPWDYSLCPCKQNPDCSSPGRRGCCSPSPRLSGWPSPAAWRWRGRTCSREPGRQRAACEFGTRCCCCWQWRRRTEWASGRATRRGSWCNGATFVTSLSFFGFVHVLGLNTQPPWWCWSGWLGRRTCKSAETSGRYSLH